jgi:glycosyltransferase involved in cell wall biosynthesis
VPQISVLLPVYNAESFISEAVSSILAQTFNDFELIIIDDASIDKTINIVKKFRDERIIFIQKEVNTGYTNSLNMGLRLARGKYIARMDADDISLPSRFAKQIEYLDQHQDVAVCGTWYEYIGSDEVIKHPVNNEQVKLALLQHCAIGHPTVMMRRSIIERNELFYDVDLEPSEDYDLWVRILKYGKIINLPEVLLQYRLHSFQVSNTRHKLQEEQAKKVRRKLISNLYVDAPDVNVTEDIKFDNDIKTNKEILLQFIKEIKKLKKLNAEKKFFAVSGFERYLETRRMHAIQSFFKNPSSSGWRSLLFFVFSEYKFYRSFNNRDKIRVLVKNLLTIKSKAL